MPVSGAAAGNVDAVMAGLDAAWGSFQERGDAAALEQLSQAVRDLLALAQSARHRRLAGLAGAIASMLDTVDDAGQASLPEFRRLLDSRLDIVTTLARALPRAPEPDAGDDGECVVVLEHEGSATHGDWRQAARFGYRLKSAPDVPALLEQLAGEAARAIILDLDCLPGGILDARMMDALFSAAGRELPVIAASQHGDMRRRLAAARAGASAYLTKPMDPIDLVDHLDEIAPLYGDSGLRILLINDRPDELAYYAAILERSGMAVTALRDPMRALDVLAEHAVDLVLLDMYMPGCNGWDLARVIRQVPEHASVPIVFLAAEMTEARRLEAMSVGADDFLIKDADPAHLIRTLEIRAQRARALRALMVTDQLTGLLNHTRVKEQLKSELAAAARRGSQMAFAMIDIDSFKSVNDSYGHPVGDRVIKTLSRVLRQRLRRTDIIGRYGGEEFAVIMPDTTAREALRVIDGVRADFAQILHVSNDGSFPVTFSAGIAAYPETADATGLAVRADDSLYAAKQAGRNRVMVAIA